MARPRPDQAVRAVERVAAEATDADELLEQLAHELRALVPHDAAMWFGMDPVTMIATEPSRVENMDASYCGTFWHLEFHEQDTALFADLAASTTGVAAMRRSLDERPARSVRFREFMRPQGFDDELRGAFRAGGRTWGVVGLYREAGRRAFDDHDAQLLLAISEPVARSLRTHVRATSPWLGQPSAPGLLIVDRHGRTISANAEAQCWLRDLWPGLLGDDPAPLASVEARPGAGGLLEVPTALIALVARARAVAEDRERVPARLRLRDARGRWIVLHASSLLGPASPDGSVAVVIEAAKSAEIAPIIIEAYSLTPRERDVLAAIARGGSTGEIAGELFLSQHTVRDYVKSVFEKVGVSSRGELVARLFGEHYSDRLHEAMVEVH